MLGDPQKDPSQSPRDPVVLPDHNPVEPPKDPCIQPGNPTPKTPDIKLNNY